MKTSSTRAPSAYKFSAIPEWCTVVLSCTCGESTRAAKRDVHGWIETHRGHGTGGKPIAIVSVDGHQFVAAAK